MQSRGSAGPSPGQDPTGGLQAGTLDLIEGTGPSPHGREVQGCHCKRHPWLPPPLSSKSRCPMPRPPRVCACGYTIAHGEACPCERTRNRSRQDDRSGARQRGYDRHWQALAREYLSAHPRCEAYACTAVARYVDHIKPVREHPERRLDRTNLQALCPRCHGVKTAAERRNRRSVERGGGGSTSTDAAGTTAPPFPRNETDFSINSSDGKRETHSKNECMEDWLWG